MCESVEGGDLRLVEQLIPLMGLDQGVDQRSVGIIDLARALHHELLAVLALGDANWHLEGVGSGTGHTDWLEERGQVEG